MPMSIRQAASQHDASGHPLPTAWPQLAAQGVEIRGGELTVIAGQPAAGKSAFALATALRIGRPTLREYGISRSTFYKALGGRTYQCR